MNRVIAFAAIAVLLGWFLFALYNDIQIQSIRDHFFPEQQDMSYVELTSNGETYVLYLNESYSVQTFADAVALAASGGVKKGSWNIQNGSITLVVPPKSGEDPLGPAHCARFEEIKEELQSRPGLEPQ